MRLEIKRPEPLGDSLEITLESDGSLCIFIESFQNGLGITLGDDEIAKVAEFFAKALQSVTVRE
jgi:hypothetical protein